jgi:beta-lactamase class C
MKFTAISLMATVAFCLGATPLVSRAADAAPVPAPAQLKHAVDAAIKPVMAKNHIAGMAVGVIAGGTPHVFNYGVASRETGRPVASTTLFEIGSVSKTFTATLASYAQLNGKLSLADGTERYLPSLRGTPFGQISLLNLGTHTPGGLPLQVPDEIHDNDQLMQYFHAWKPTYAPGTYRTYANPGIGTLGLIAATSMGQDFTALIEQRVFPAFGMHNSFIDVPAAKMRDYAQGYRKDDTPVRMTPGVLSAEAYGVRTTAADMLRFVAANMNLLEVDSTFQQAVNATHTGYFKAGVLTQDLIWEQYPYPVALKTLQEGNGSAMVLNATPAVAITPPLAPSQDVWINKTGSTNGFGTYVAFVPQQKIGIVILANKNLPTEDRVNIAYRILTELAQHPH